MMRSDLSLPLLVSLTALLGCGATRPEVHVAASTPAAEQTDAGAGEGPAAVLAPDVSPPAAGAGALSRAATREPTGDGVLVPCSPERGRIQCSIDPLCSPPSGTTVLDKECGLIVAAGYESALRANVDSACQLRNAAWLMQQSLTKNAASLQAASVVTPGLRAAMEGFLKSFSETLTATALLAQRLEMGDEEGANRARPELLRAIERQERSLMSYVDICLPDDGGGALQ